jgi:chemotaxis protein methyltransferase CheR
MSTMTTASTATTASTMTSAQFDQFCNLVRRESAIVLEPGKEYLVESRLAPIARREGLASVGALLQRLASSPTVALRAAMLDAMTTNETSFFRDVHPWHALKTEILPQLIEARKASKTLTIWCAACSSGQEPYSLAMLLADEFPEVARTWKIRIISTDISPSMVARCEQGLFSQLEVNRGLPAAMLPRHFTRDGMQFRIDAGVSKMLDVRLGNLLAMPPVAQLGDLDLVMIRNVLIYFDDTTKRKIISEIRSRVRRDGVLMLGSSEIAAGNGSEFVRHQSGKTVYFRPR